VQIIASFVIDLDAIANDKYVPAQISLCEFNSPKLFGNSRYRITFKIANLDDETYRYPPKCNEINWKSRRRNLRDVIKDQITHDS